MTDKGNMVLRGGYGIFFDRPNMRLYNVQLFNMPYEMIATELFTPNEAPFADVPLPSAFPLNLSNTTIFPFGGYPAFLPYTSYFYGAIPSSPVPATGVYPDLHDWAIPYVQDFNLGLQTSLANNWMLDVGYVGSTGRKFPRLFSFNQAASPALVLATYSAGSLGGPFFPGFGNLTAPGFGLNRDEYDRLVHTTDSVIHCAASLNRKSEKSCLNVNLRGTLEVLMLARHAEHYHGLRRFSEVSTVAVAGKRSNEVVTEDNSIEWDRSDYDPYARTKKFCEHMTRVLLPDTPKTVFRPSIVLGDSRHAETTQFDMVKAFVFLAGLPVLPFRSKDQIDIVNVDFVANAIAMSLGIPTISPPLTSASIKVAM
jgi:hypothetical protein